MNLNNINLDSSSTIVIFVIVALLVLMVAKKLLKLAFFLALGFALYYLFAAK